MFVWVRRLFPSWSHFAEYVAFLAAITAGIGAFPWGLGILLPALLLTLLSWPRWRELVMKAWRLDRDWWDLGDLARTHNVGTWLGYYLRSRNAAFVLAVKFVHDCFYITLAFVFGHLIGWFWLR